MRISDEKRREVVARLREWLAIPWYERPLSRDAMQSLGKMVGAVPGENIVERLADLIDRPTCTIVCEFDAYSSWGERIDVMRLYELSCGHQAVGFEKPRYCPKCGSVITDVKR